MSKAEVRAALPVRVNVSLTRFGPMLAARIREQRILGEMVQRLMPRRAPTIIEALTPALLHHAGGPTACDAALRFAAGAARVRACCT